MSEKTVLSIDPGTEKCGFALVHRTDEEKLDVIYRAIAPTEHLVSFIHKAYSVEPFEMVIVGSGTGSKKVVHSLRESFPSVSLLVVDEKDTSLHARERYWEHHPRTGWRRLLPSSLQVPPAPIDDFAAVVLAERVLLQS